MKLLKIALKILFCLFIFCLGFVLSELRYIDRMDGVHFYVYDTQQKIEDYHRRVILEGVSSEGREFKWRPLVEIGPFFAFHLVDSDSSRFSMHEKSSLMPFVQLESNEQSRKLSLFSSVEKGWGKPRFGAIFRYSKDGVYERGFFSVFRKDGTPERTYFDSRRIGVFDVMHVFEDGVRVTYHLNDITWERIDEGECDTETDVGDANP